MQTTDLETIEHARAAIEEIVSSRYLGVQAVPSVAPTDFGLLTPAMQEAEMRIAEDNDHGNRLRAGIHMCLSAASVALEVSERLMADFAELPPAERIKVLMRCAEDAMAASDAARHAAGILAGEEPPETESFFEISRF